MLSWQFWRRLALVLVLLHAACSPPTVAAPGDAPAAKAKDAKAASSPREPGPIPVTRADPTIGDATAPVTIVMFGDFECPYCRDGSTTMRQLLAEYGPKSVRLVWKNLPLPAHPMAMTAAHVGAGVHRLGGDGAFWRYHAIVFGSPNRIQDAIIEAVSRQEGLDEEALVRALRAGAVEKVRQDLLLASELGVSGTPEFFINGRHVSGALEATAFRSIIDEELAAAREARLEAGEDMDEVAWYATRSAENRARETDGRPKDAPTEQAAAQAMFYVPIGSSPVLGAATAPVTLVVFSDFQCPFCTKMRGTIEALRKTYGERLRVVFKHNPLPFHDEADDAAALSIEARVQRGEAGFWAAYDAIFDHQEDLDEEALREIAAAAKLDVPRAIAAVRSKRHMAVVRADLDLAIDLGVRGTPHAFVNGRPIEGARPIAEISAVIDAALTEAAELVRAGTKPADVYDAVMSRAERMVPERLELGAAPSDAPSRGPRSARVEVQVFSDFECPFCRKHVSALQEIAKEYSKDVRIVWRHLPMRGHPNAPLASEAALEARRQKGDAGFWAMHDAIFEAQGDPGGLSKENLERVAEKLKLDQVQFRAALADGRHKARVQADLEVAADAGIDRTPVTIVNGYKVVGAVGDAKLGRAVRRAFEDLARQDAARKGTAGK